MSEKLPLSKKLRYFRGSPFSKCFILWTALHCSLPSKFFMLTITLSNYQYCPVPLMSASNNVYVIGIIKTSLIVSNLTSSSLEDIGSVTSYFSNFFKSCCCERQNAQTLEKPQTKIHNKQSLPSATKYKIVNTCFSNHFQFHDWHIWVI